MKKHTLVCLLKDDPKGSFKTVKLSSKPDIKKLRDIYFKNVETLNYIVQYCKNNNIKSLRVISGLFPLASHTEYRDICAPLLTEVGKEYQKIDFNGVELSAHPDQFILLSSVNPDINANSRYDLEIYAKMREYIPWNLVNIHVGSKNQGLGVHSQIVRDQIKLLSHEARQILSFENDEKSYSLEETLSIAEENGIMVVPDFHHERCLQKRISDNGIGMSYAEHINWNGQIDQIIYRNLQRIVDTYNGKDATPLFHLSSPVSGWNGVFKDHCQHSDLINIDDYPFLLESKMNGKDYRLDIEAKDKNRAIIDIETKLKNVQTNC